MSHNSNISDLATKIAYYEKVKLRNFIASCKLEGIEVVPPTLTKEQIIEKYTKKEQK